MDHAFPSRKVVAEGTLQPDIFLNERIDVDGYEVGRPADLRHLPIRTRERQRNIERPARARCVAHETGAEWIEPADDALHVFPPGIDAAGRAQPHAGSEPRP